jgi:anthranilate phosphoribosyltransferase
MVAIQDAIRALVDRGELSAPEAGAAMEAIMSGEATPGQIGAFLAALRIRGETADVIAACLQVMLAHAEPVPANDVVDLCGTGGDGADTFNVSTAAGFVVAACGVRVAKHGNRSASSKCGSADLLEHMGAKLDLTGEQAAGIIDACGFCFLFAQRFHPAMRHAGPIRREMGTRTIFNVVGPLSNPANPRAQLVGVSTAALGPLVIEALRLRGMARAMVVHSAEGLDEISPAGSTRAWLLKDGAVTERELTPATFGLRPHALSEVGGGGPAENATAMLGLLAGAAGPVRDFVVMNAAAALVVAGKAPGFVEGAQLAEGAITSGAARAVLERYIALSQEAGGE